MLYAQDVRQLAVRQHILGRYPYLRIFQEVEVGDFDRNGDGEARLVQDTRIEALGASSEVALEADIAEGGMDCELGGVEVVIPLLNVPLRELVPLFWVRTAR